MKYNKLLLILISVLGVNLLQADDSLSFKAKGKETIEVRFNGRLQAQFDGLSLNNEPSTNHYYFRRLFLGAKAKLSNGVFAESVFDFAGDQSPEIAFDKAIIGYKFDSGITGILGFQKVPFGFEETTSSSKLQTIERSAINRFFADDIDFSSRHMGLHFKGDLSGGLSYAFALVNSAQGEGSRLGGVSNTSTDAAAFGRLQWSSDTLTLGADYGKQTGNLVLSDIDDQSELITNAVDVHATTGYINYKLGDINLLGEYFTGDLGEAGEADGYSIRASIKSGKWEPVIRYSTAESDWKIDSDELIRRAPNGGGASGDGSELTSKYIGLNYYYSKAVTLMAGYEDAESSDEDDNFEIDGFRARVQVLW